MRTLLPPALVALALPLLSAAPAGAANDQDPRLVEKTVVYSCESALGDGDIAVSVRVLLPKTTVAGRKLAARPMDLTFVVPEEMTQALRDQGVEEVSGESEDATYSIGNKTRDIKDLVLPPTPVPDQGPLTLEGQGLAQAVRLTRVASYPVRLPELFTATVTVSGGFDATTTLTCALADGESAKLTSLKVVPDRD